MRLELYKIHNILAKESKFHIEKMPAKSLFAGKNSKIPFCCLLIHGIYTRQVARRRYGNLHTLIVHSVNAYDSCILHRVSLVASVQLVAITNFALCKRPTWIHTGIKIGIIFPDFGPVNDYDHF